MATEMGALLRTALARTALSLAATAALLTGCGVSGGVTSAALNSAVGPTFARLYFLQQQELGHATEPTDGHASCTRGTPAEADRGAGDDWSCTVNFPYPDGHVEPLSYDLTVNATGCYTADGPPATVGQQHLATAAGPIVTNPLFAFDGCIRLG